MFQKKNNPDEYRLFRTRLLLSFCAIALLLAFGFVWKVQADYHAAQETARSQTSNLVQAIRAHIINSMESLDEPLKATSDAVTQLAEEGKLEPAHVKSLLTSPMLPPSAGYWLMLVDKTGHAIAASNGLPVEGVGYADRAYFKVHADQSTHGIKQSLYVGSPDMGRVSKKRSFFVSRRVEKSNGEFLGVIVAVVDATSFAKVMQLSQYEPNLSITMANIDGKIMVRIPLYEESFGKDISKSTLFNRLTKDAKGSYSGVSLIDGDRRIYAYERLDHYPVVVAVGMVTPNLSIILKKDILGIIAGSLSVFLVMFFGGRYALKSFQEVKAGEALQKSLNKDLEEAKEKVEASERNARMIADNMPALVAYIDDNQRYKFRNSYYKKIPGIEYESMLGKTMLEVFGEENHASIAKEVELALAGTPSTFERDRKSHDGSTRTLRYQYSPDIQPDGSVRGFYTLVSDVTDMKSVQTQLMALARIDSLTGLPNRAFLYERMDEAIARASRANYTNGEVSRLGCLYLDIDHFKKINDTYGHAGGDAVLKEFGVRLKKCVRQTDMVARIAGDEFVILLEGLDQPIGAQIVATKIVQAMAEPMKVEGRDVSITTSIGISIFSESLGGADFMLRQADLALYEAKSSGRNMFSVGPIDQTKSADTKPLDMS